jgi:predicted AAA+ superfamily ATPase
MYDHKNLGQRRHEIQKMVNVIGLVAATSGYVQVFKWVLWNNFYIEELWRQYDVFHLVTNNGHIEILEWVDMKDMHWYRQEMLEDAVARTDLDVLLFLLKKKPRQFNLMFTTMCLTNGYTEVLEWWKEMEIVELFGVAVQSPQ